MPPLRPPVARELLVRSNIKIVTTEPAYEVTDDRRFKVNAGLHGQCLALWNPSSDRQNAKEADVSEPPAPDRTIATYTTPVGEWIAGNWGSLASVLGLFLSAWAAVAATLARRAADDAKKAVEIRSLSGALKSCGDDVSALELYFDSKSWKLAEAVVSRTLRELSYIASRWKDHLDNSSTANCSLASAQLDTLQNELRKFRSRAPKDSEVRSIYKGVDRVAALLAAEFGKSEAKIDVVAATRTGGKHA